MASLGFAATFGTVVPISGQAADVALDEARNVVYVANYTANRIDVVSTQTRQLQTSINVAPQPSALALSPSGRYLVVAHVSNFQSPAGSPNHSLTVIDLNGSTYHKQTFGFGSAPLGVAFGNDGLALVVTENDFLLFDPSNGYMITIGTVADVTAKALPVDIGDYPRDIIGAAVTASGDGSRIFGTLEAQETESQTLEFQYDVRTHTILPSYWTAEPPAGPRVVSVDRTGSTYLTGWAMHRASDFVIMAQFPNAVGDFAIGSHVIDSAHNTVYAQISMSSAFQVWPPSSTPYTGPVLMVADADNLAVRQELKLAENLSGRSVLNAAGTMMYSVSDSGLMILPVGQLAEVPVVASNTEQLLFRGAWCDRTSQSQTIVIQDNSGGNIDFSLTTDLPGVTLSPSTGTTPAVVTVTVDNNALQNYKGTSEGLIEIQSGDAVNVPVPVRILVNNREPDQRGSFFSVPGKLVDVIADPARNRFYVLRQDRNEVLVFDASNYTQIATLRTGNTPWSMAITFDKKYLLTGADNSQVVHMFDLDTLHFIKVLPAPYGHYPRWVAVSGSAILAASRVAGPVHTIDRIQMYGMGTALPSLGVFSNDIDIDTAIAGSPSGNYILGVMADGRTLLYDSTAGTFISARKDFTKLSGGFGVLSDDFMAVDTHVLNSSLVPVQLLDSGGGSSSGFAAQAGMGLRTTAADNASPGVIQRLDLSQSVAIPARPTRMAEAPPVPDPNVSGTSITVFRRSLAPLANGTAIVSLSTSGFTVLSSNYDASVADPMITSVVNAADGTAGVAPGGLISIFGSDLSPVNAASNQVPLPTALGDSCMTVNGVLVPIVFVSPTRINAQLPVDVSGRGTMILRTPAGVSNTFYFPILPVAPAVFDLDVEGWDIKIPSVTRGSDNLLVTPSRPIHLGTDRWLVIYITGLGATIPTVASGAGGPFDPLAEAAVLPQVTLDGQDLAVFYAGLVPGQVGTYQINVQMPLHNTDTGMQIPLTIKQGTYQTTVYVRVVE
jgi:uncharacterized protein (TIGR03437 family)